MSAEILHVGGGPGIDRTLLLFAGFDHRELRSVMSAGVQLTRFRERQCLFIQYVASTLFGQERDQWLQCVEALLLGHVGKDR